MAKKKTAEKKTKKKGTAATETGTSGSKTARGSKKTRKPKRAAAKKKSTTSKSPRRKKSSEAPKAAQQPRSAPKNARKSSSTRSKTTRRSSAPRSISESNVKVELARHWDELLPEQQLAQAILNYHRGQLMQNPEVTGFHVGLRRNGPDQRVVLPLEYVIRIHVTRKHPPGHPMIRQLLPERLSLPGGESVRVDVMERSYQSVPGGVLPEDRFLEPVRGGAPIARKDLGTLHWGTLGIRARLGNQLVAITNKHVISVPDPGGAGTADVVQPATGRVDGDEDPIIGYVHRSIHDEEIDCSLIVDNTSCALGSGVVDAEGRRIPGTYVARRLTAADEKNTEVFKVGARTGDDPRLMATVKSVCSSVRIEHFGWMNCQIVAESVDGTQIIEEGDSGAVLIARVEDDGMFTNCVVGLVHAEACDRTAIVACHFDRVQDRMGIRL